MRRMTAEQFSDGVASITGEWPALPRLANPPAGGRRAPLVISARRRTARGSFASCRAPFRSGRRTCGISRRLVVYSPVEGVALRRRPHLRPRFRFRPPITFGNGASPVVAWIARWDVRSAIRCIHPRYAGDHHTGARTGKRRHADSLAVARRPAECSGNCRRNRSACSRQMNNIGRAPPPVRNSGTRR